MNWSIPWAVVVPAGRKASLALMDPSFLDCRSVLRNFLFFLPFFFGLFLLGTIKGESSLSLFIHSFIHSFICSKFSSFFNTSPVFCLSLPFFFRRSLYEYMHVNRNSFFFTFQSLFFLRQRERIRENDDVLIFLGERYRESVCSL